MPASICKECGIVMRPTEKEGAVVLVCGNCGASKDFNDWTERECSSCGYNKMVVEYFGVIIGDEPALILYRCIKCNSVDREGIS